MEAERIYYSEERCVMCGDYVPEGRMVCLCCERKVMEAEPRPSPVKQEIERKGGFFQKLLRF